MLTKQTIKKLNEAPVEVKLWNGNFNVASVKIHNNKKDYELLYELSHPLLEQYSGKRDKCEFLVWTGHSAPNASPPEELKGLVQRLKEAAIMPNDVVIELLIRNYKAVEEFYKAFYPSLKD